MKKVETINKNEEADSLTISLFDILNLIFLESNKLSQKGHAD